MKRTALAISISLWSSLALAGGFEYPDVGTVAMGRGAAFAAKADDGTAIYYNPAGLADQDGWRVTLDVTMGDQQTSYQRQDVTGADIGSSITNNPGLFFAPFVAVSRGFNLGFFGKLAVAVGVYSPPANAGIAFPDETPPVLTTAQKLQFEAQGCTSAPAPSACPGASTSSANQAPQKYQFINQNLLVLYPTLSAAWQPIPLVSIGASFQLLVANAAFRQATYDGASAESGAHQSGNEQLTYDTIANVSVSGVTVNANFGVKVHPLPGLSLGASYKPKSTLNQSGTLKLDFSPLAQFLSARATGAGTSNASDGSSGTGPTTLTNSFPGELKTGVDYDFGLFDLELDFDWTQWSQYQAAVITPSFGQAIGPSSATPTAVAPIVVTRDFQDTWSLRLGGELKLPVPVVRARVRAGVGYESNPYNSGATEYVYLNYANFDQVWGAIGATVGIGAFDFDLTYSHVYMPTQTVNNSGVLAQENNAPTGVSSFNVGDGKYTTAYDLLALGVRAHF